MSFDWKRALGVVAPTLATMVGGPLAGTAVSAIASVFGLGGDATEAQISKAVQGATPEQLLALKKADQDFAIRMRELDLEPEKLAAADRASARDREAKTGDSLTPRLLALFITTGFFGVLGWLLYAGAPPKGGDALLIMLGGLGTAWAGVVAYYFGSSAGSRDKDTTIKSLSR
jgi:hypothetical protein